MSRSADKPARSYATKPERVCGISLNFQPPNPITIHFHSFKTATRFPFYCPSFSQLPRLITLPLLKKLVGTSIFKIELKIMTKEDRSSNDPSPPFKRKEKEGEGRSKAWRSMEGKGEGSHAWWPMDGEGKGSHAWWPMEGEGKGSHAWWPMVGEKKIIFTSPHFPPNQIYLNLQFFPLTLRFYFTMVLGHYSRVSFLSLIYKLRLRTSM
jgi:hypothetical protein